MASYNWQLEAPATAIIFDCDGTLSSIEGIDELAKQNGVSVPVQRLTAQAMGHTGMNPDVYQQRLDLVRPTTSQVNELGQHYFDHQIPDIASVIQIFHRLKKSVYIMSAGIYPAVMEFGRLLEIPKQHIFAVNIQFDAQGHYRDFDRTSALIHNDGKRRLVLELKKTHHTMIYVGDGANDLATIDVVHRFIGYGGVFYRESIAKHCEFYLRELSMATLLPLCLTEEEALNLPPNEQLLYQKGLLGISPLLANQT